MIASISKVAAGMCESFECDESACGSIRNIYAPDGSIIGEWHGVCIKCLQMYTHIIRAQQVELDDDARQHFNVIIIMEE